MKAIWREFEVLDERLRNTGPLVELGRECDEAIGWADRSLDLVKKKAMELEARFRAMHETWSGITAPSDLKPYSVYYQQLAAWFMLVGAGFAVAFECLLQGALSVMIFNFPWPWAVLVGVITTLAVTYLLKGLVSMFFGRHAQHPRKAREVLTWSVGVLLPVQILLLALLFLVTRSFADSGNSLMWLFWPVSSALAITTPLLAAVLLVGAGLFGWSGSLTREYDELLTVERRIWGLRHHAEIIRPCLILMLGLCAASGVFAQSPVVSIDVDATASVVGSDRAAAISTVADTLFPLTFGWAQQLRLSTFASDAWTAIPFYQRSLPSYGPPSAPSPELNRVDFMFKGQVAFKRQQTHSVYQRNLNAYLADYRRQLNEAVSEAVANLKSVVMVDGPCTSFWDLIARYSESTSPARIVAITDGVESCRPAPESIPAPKDGVRVVVVLLATKADRYPALGYEARKRTILQVAPWVTVVPRWNFNVCLFGASTECAKIPKIHEEQPLAGQ